MGFASIYSAEYADKLLKAGTPELMNSQPIGTGPFVFTRFQKDAVVRYKANPDYFAGKPSVEGLIYAITPDANVRLQKLRQNECQIALSPKPQADQRHHRQHRPGQAITATALPQQAGHTARNQQKESRQGPALCQLSRRRGQFPFPPAGRRWRAIVAVTQFCRWQSRGKWVRRSWVFQAASRWCVRTWPS